MPTAVRPARSRLARTLRWLSGVLAVVLLLGLPGGLAGADEITGSYDSLRTGWDAAEPGLSPSSVSSSDFGQLFSTPVDGEVYAQPLVANGSLVAATENNTIYGLDPVTGAQKWSRHLGPAWPAATLNCGDLVPTIGVTSTPVYDPNTGAVYLTSKVNDGPDAQHPHWYLHAVDPATGAERAGFPVTIQGTPTNNPSVPFLPETAMQRPALLLLDGVVYLGFGSHCDATPYAGYVVGVNSSTGKITTLWSTEASASSEAGIWQSGGGLVSDGSGRIIAVTGNGVAPAPGPGDTPPSTLGESVVRLGVNTDGSLSAHSFFSPANNARLNQDDADLGSGGPMALPANFGTTSHPHLVVVVGKSGQLYLLDADHLGGTAQGPNGTDLVVGTAGPFNGVWGHPAFWGGDGGWVYTVENGGPLRAYEYTNSGGTPGLVSIGTSVGTFPYGSGSPVVTSDGTTSGSALVWAVSTDAGTNGQLRAFDPVPQNGVLNQRYALPLGKTAKFTVPATDSGRIYVGTYDGHIIGVGRPTTSPLTTASFDFGQVAVGTPANGTVTVTANKPVTINGVATAAPFTASATTPVTLAQGQTYSVQVTFTPSTWGQVTKSLTFTMSDGTTTALDLRGTGTQPGLGASPSSLNFGQVRTGTSKQLGVNIVNTGTTAETISSVTAPSAPYTISNAPAAGTVLAAGASITIPVTYTPTTGSDTGITNNDNLVVTADQGSVTVPITGTALTGQPQLTLSLTSLDFGIVPVGQSVTKTFQVSNTGTVPLTITKAKAPTGSFWTNTPLAEGQVIAPGDSITQSVTYTASTAWPEQAQYEITGNDGQAAQYVSLGGNLDPIATYYQQLGGSRGSYLSDPVSAEYDIGATATSGPTGRGQDFRGGSIYWSPASGAHAMGGAILDHYKALGGPTGSLGYPTTDELGTPDGVGRYNHFTGTGGWAGSIYWTPNTGAHEVLGAIHAEWAATGWEHGPLGYPTTDETVTPDGVGHYNHFTGQGGMQASIYWTPNTGAHEVQGAIHAEWAATGWENGPLGYPTTDESVTPDGVGHYNHFTGTGGWAGSIYWTPNTGAHELHGAIRARWAQLGWERSGLGYPTSDEFGVTGGRRNNFEHRTLTWIAADGSVQVFYY